MVCSEPSLVFGLMRCSSDNSTSDQYFILKGQSFRLLLDDSIAILDGMKTVLVVSSLVLLVMVGASTAQGQGAGGQQQEQNGQTTTAPNNGFTMDNNMMMMMMMIPMMKRVRTSFICFYRKSQQSSKSKFWTFLIRIRFSGSQP